MYIIIINRIWAILLGNNQKLADYCKIYMSQGLQIWIRNDPNSCVQFKILWNDFPKRENEFDLVRFEIKFISNHSFCFIVSHSTHANDFNPNIFKIKSLNSFAEFDLKSDLEKLALKFLCRSITNVALLSQLDTVASDITTYDKIIRTN